jgi:hypothetical protein
MNFRLKKGFTLTYAGPEYLNCFGSARPIIHCFKTRAFVLNKTGKDVRIWFVGTSIPQLIDGDTRMEFYKKNGAFSTRGKNRLIRSFTSHTGEKLQVFYTRTSAVRAFDRLVAARKEENAQARKELGEALAKGDYATASAYI